MHVLARVQRVSGAVGRSVAALAAMLRLRGERVPSLLAAPGAVNAARLPAAAACAGCPLRRTLALALVLAGAAGIAHAAGPEVEERVVRVAAGGDEMVVTVFLPAGSGPRPLAVINHGRSGNPEARARLRRQRYSGPARFFAERGYAVVVPTRVGYGEAGGADREHHGRCDDPDYGRAFAGAVSSIRAAIAWAATEPWADATRIVVLGTSVGGVASLAVAAQGLPGVVAAINFAGGKGGNPRWNGQPCSPERLGDLLAAYARATRVPTLWIYAENDLFFGPEVAREWHRRYVAAGGAARFVMLPPHGEDGHRVFAQARSWWRPHVEGFLGEAGLPAGGS